MRSAQQQLALAMSFIASERIHVSDRDQQIDRAVTALLEFARTQTSFYRERLRHVDLTRTLVRNENWRSVPLLTRSDIQTQGHRLIAALMPKEHGRRFSTQTSGSTGQPVKVQRTDFTNHIWQVLSLRDHLWHSRDSSLAQAVIRAYAPSAPPPNGVIRTGWGEPFDSLGPRGTLAFLDINTDVAEQAEWLRRIQPHYWLTHPNNLNAVLECCSRDEYKNLRQVLCIGEVVSPALREKCRQVVGVEIASVYSSQELGYIALQCPDCGQYHVQTEAVFVEVLDDEGRTCEAGQVGRVVVTDLCNFAMPLIRYQIGDYAEVGEPCSAGRTLPSLRKVLGRRRNMVVHADGRCHWPVTGFAKFSSVAPVRQFQFVQHTVDHIEIRLVCDQLLTAEQDAAIRKIVSDALGHDFIFDIKLSAESLLGTSGGKFEEFISLVP
jgi:phenylacetate-CoA ligase